MAAHPDGKHGSHEAIRAAILLLAPSSTGGCNGRKQTLCIGARCRRHARATWHIAPTALTQCAVPTRQRWWSGGPCMRACQPGRACTACTACPLPVGEAYGDGEQWRAARRRRAVPQNTPLRLEPRPESRSAGAGGRTVSACGAARELGRAPHLLIVIALARQPHPHAPRHALDALAPQKLVELGVEANIRRAHHLLGKRLHLLHRARRALLEPNLVQQLAQVDGVLASHHILCALDGLGLARTLGHGARDSLRRNCGVSTRRRTRHFARPQDQ
eukprot:scaffold7258_cov122-Isochrysis_galbana.AAC.6